MEQTYLAHFGTKHMKWGVRRFEDAAGRLTEAGKVRYSQAKVKTTEVAKASLPYTSDRKLMNDASKGLSAAAKIGTNQQKSKTIKKDYSKMSDDELKKRVTRLNLETQYGNLSGDTKKVRSGSDYVHEILQNAAIAATIVASSVSVYLAIKSKGVPIP